MFINSEKMPDDSRVWVYQSNRIFTENEEKKIAALTEEFLETWTAHSQDLRASFEIRYHLFLIIMIDVNHALASGCSIDKSVHFIQKLEKELSVSLLDRQIFAIRQNSSILLIKRNDFEKMMGKEISNDSIVFNNLVQTKIELNTVWEVPVKESWHAALIN